MININGIAWRIYLVSPSDPILMRSDGSRTIGACDNEKEAIYICKYLEPRLMKKVLCHEIAHAAMFSYDVELDVDQEELLADLMATYGQEIICLTNKIIGSHC